MQGYKLTPEQKTELDGKEYKQGCFFNPVPDANGDYFIFEQEVQGCEKPNYGWVKELELIDYTPTQEPLDA